MARGWETKSVESQIDAAEDRSQRVRPSVSETQIRLNALRESIELSRERILRELRESVHPRHQDQLQAALAHLDVQLTNLAPEK